MLLLAGVAAGGVVDLISSLKQTDSGKHKPGTTADSVFGWPSSQSASTDTSDDGTSSTTSSNSISPATMRMLLWLQAHGLDVSSEIFSKLDADSSGGISKSEFEEMFANSGDSSKADALFAKLDGDSDGSVSEQELAAGLRNGHRRHGPTEEPAGSAEASGDASRIATNTDGSTTFTVTREDGTQFTMTQTALNTNGATTSLLERAIQRHIDFLTKPMSGQALAKAA